MPARKGRLCPPKVLLIARRWWWIVAAYVLTSRMTPIYSAQAVLLVNQAQNPNVVTYQDILGSQQLTKTYAELATSSTILDRTSQKINDPLLSGSVLAKKVSASAVTQTQLINITAEDPSPARAALVANTVAEIFPAYVEEAQLAGKTGAGGQPLNTVFVAEKANAPTAPVRPNKALNAFLGLIVMLGTVALVEYLDDGIDGLRARAERGEGVARLKCRFG